MSYSSLRKFKNWHSGKTEIIFNIVIMSIQEQIQQEMVQAMIDTWCLSHGIDPKYVTYKDGNICIPVNF